MAVTASCVVHICNIRTYRTVLSSSDGDKWLCMICEQESSDLVLFLGGCYDLLLCIKTGAMLHVIKTAFAPGSLFIGDLYIQHTSQWPLYNEQ